MVSSMSSRINFYFLYIHIHLYTKLSFSRYPAPGSGVPLRGMGIGRGPIFVRHQGHQIRLLDGYHHSRRGVLIHALFSPSDGGWLASESSRHHRKVFFTEAAYHSHKRSAKKFQIFLHLNTKTSKKLQRCQKGRIGYFFRFSNPWPLQKAVRSRSCIDQHFFAWWAVATHCTRIFFWRGGGAQKDFCVSDYLFSEVFLFSVKNLGCPKTAPKPNKIQENLLFPPANCEITASDSLHHVSVSTPPGLEAL